MNSKHIILAVFVFAALAMSLSGQTEPRIAATWQVQKYDINATLPQADADRNLVVKAKVDVKNVSGQPASTLTLRIGAGADVTAVTINGASVDFTKGRRKNKFRSQPPAYRFADPVSRGQRDGLGDGRLQIQRQRQHGPECDLAGRIAIFADFVLVSDAKQLVFCTRRPILHRSGCRYRAARKR